ncbi:hypothetical protein [Chryseobacterium vrystaatense]|uniref:CarboxypepD_reg-like domain-containing protein n=1 Tax=Chryseobacterium vrystaatense TaxID=307480 RepID=A0ABR4UMQ7_9FLAO|nr:hypothetical protein [Chryseobacterium vrystaatense]KFF26264.1 hypothetical protein IW16_10360 [Chryseobacterium vrystaatense]
MNCTRLLYFSILLVFSFCKAQVKLGGVIITEEGRALGDVSIFQNGILKSYSNSEGIFSIEAEAESEITFLKTGYDVIRINITSNHIQNFKVILRTSVHLIPEVEISQIKISGNLKKDVLQFKSNDKIKKLQDDIGLPKSPEKPRERPPELMKDVIIPLLGANICLEDVYKVVSGDSKRMKRLYQYQDLQSDVQWLESNISSQYFTDIGIPIQRVHEFLEFSLVIDQNIKPAMKENNTSKILLSLEMTGVKFKNRLRLQKKSI